MKIGLLSDTHGFLDPGIFSVFEHCDEIWHAGDFGRQSVIDELKAFKPLKGVFGNIDAPEIRHQFPLQLHWQAGEYRVSMTHIAGYPGKYPPKIKHWIKDQPCDLFLCGHSHILKIMKDPILGHLHINPGAAGHEGFHHMRTAVRFELINNQLHNLEIIELGLRGHLHSSAPGLSSTA